MELKKEPALTEGAIGAAIVALLLAYRLVTAEQALAWGTILSMILTAAVPLIQAKRTRDKVMPVATIKEAGLNPEAINRAAHDPTVRPYNGP